MRIAQFTIAAMCVGMTFVACQKDSKLPGNQNPKQLRAAPSNSEDVISQLFDRYRKQNTQVFKFSAGKNFYVETNDGITISVLAGSLRRPNGSVETGMVTMSVWGITSTADQALGGAPTQSVYSEGQQGGGDGIVTAGAVKIDMVNDAGQPLSSPGEGVTVEIPADPETGFDSDMSAWDGVPSPNQPRDNVWDENTDPVDPGSDGSSYNFKWEQNGLINIDKLKNCPDPKTGYQLFVTGPFTQSNTQVYAVTKPCDTGGNGPNVVFSLDMYNPAAPYWFANPNADLSVGTSVTFVAISYYNGQLYYGFSAGSVTPAMTVTISNMSVTNMTALMAYLNSL